MTYAYRKSSNKQQSEQTARPSMYPQGYFHPKPCKRCEGVFTPKAPSHLYCSEPCRTTADAEKYYTNHYGIGLIEWDAMYGAQKGLCAICNREGFTMRESHVAKLMVDHCHTTGRVRGLLCHNCNRGLGLFQDSPDVLTRAVEYLKSD